jgi:predicted metalloendopeptidase
VLLRCGGGYLLEKLAAFRSKIGYPSKWRDYSKLEVQPDDAFGKQA